MAQAATIGTKKACKEVDPQPLRHNIIDFTRNKKIDDPPSRKHYFEC